MSDLSARTEGARRFAGEMLSTAADSADRTRAELERRPELTAAALVLAGVLLVLVGLVLLAVRRSTRRHQAAQLRDDLVDAVRLGEIDINDFRVFAMIDFCDRVARRGRRPSTGRHASTRPILDSALAGSLISAVGPGSLLPPGGPFWPYASPEAGEVEVSDVWVRAVSFQRQLMGKRRSRLDETVEPVPTPGSAPGRRRLVSVPTGELPVIGVKAVVAEEMLLSAEAAADLESMLDDDATRAEADAVRVLEIVPDLDVLDLDASDLDASELDVSGPDAGATRTGPIGLVPSSRASTAGGSVTDPARNDPAVTVRTRDVAALGRAVGEPALTVAMDAMDATRSGPAATDVVMTVGAAKDRDLEDGVTAEGVVASTGLRDVGLGDVCLVDVGLVNPGLRDAGSRGAGPRDAGLANTGLVNASAVNLGLVNLGLVNLGLVNLGLVNLSANPGEANRGGEDLRWASPSGANSRGVNTSTDEPASVNPNGVNLSRTKVALVIPGLVNLNVANSRGVNPPATNSAVGDLGTANPPTANGSAANADGEITVAAGIPVVAGPTAGTVGFDPLNDPLTHPLFGAGDAPSEDLEPVFVAASQATRDAERTAREEAVSEKAAREDAAKRQAVRDQLAVERALLERIAKEQAARAEAAPPRAVRSIDLRPLEVPRQIDLTRVERGPVSGDEPGTARPVPVAVSAPASTPVSMSTPASPPASPRPAAAHRAADRVVDRNRAPAPRPSAARPSVPRPPVPRAEPARTPVDPTGGATPSGAPDTNPIPRVDVEPTPRWMAPGTPDVVERVGGVVEVAGSPATVGTRDTDGMTGDPQTGEVPRPGFWGRRPARRQRTTITQVTGHGKPAGALVPFTGQVPVQGGEPSGQDVRETQDEPVRH